MTNKNSVAACSALSIALVSIFFFGACSESFGTSGNRTLTNEEKAMDNMVTYLNPEGLHKNPAFTQAVVVGPNMTTIYVGGQNALDSSGNIVGKNDIGAQTETALRNLEIALESAGAELHNVVKWNVYILAGQSVQKGFAAFKKVWGQRPNPPAITGVMVAAFGNPDFLVEIDAVAVIPVP